MLPVRQQPPSGSANKFIESRIGFPRQAAVISRAWFDRDVSLL